VILFRHLLSRNIEEVSAQQKSERSLRWKIWSKYRLRPNCT